MCYIYRLHLNSVIFLKFFKKVPERDKRSCHRKKILDLYFWDQKLS